MLPGVGAVNLKAILLAAWLTFLACAWGVLLTAGSWLWHYLWFRNRKDEPPAEVVTRWVVILAGAGILLSAVCFGCSL